jgi:hypothetical protein
VRVGVALLVEGVQRERDHQRHRLWRIRVTEPFERFSAPLADHFAEHPLDDRYAPQSAVGGPVSPLRQG